MSQRDRDAWIQEARDADILEVAISHGAQLKRSGHEYCGPCPACGGRDRFSINVAKRIFNCRGAVGGDVIRMVEHIEGIPFLAACQEINGCPPPDGRNVSVSDEERKRIRAHREQANRERRTRQEMAEKDNRVRAGDLWREGTTLSATAAEFYLHHRGIPTPRDGWPDCFRFHPRLPYPQGAKYPALLCRADNAKGVPVAIWRIYLAPDGSGKADVPNAKLGLGGVTGAAVRIGGVAPHVGVAEGVESALGAWHLVGQAFPVWAALSTSGVAGFEPPATVSRVVVFPDGDKPMKRMGEHYVPAEPVGRAAANKLRARMMTRPGVDCLITAEPPVGSDYLDLWNQQRRRGAA